MKVKSEEIGEEVKCPGQHLTLTKLSLTFIQEAKQGNHFERVYSGDIYSRYLLVDEFEDDRMNL